jgi:multicomponent Na+:H+ antiporter subunit B
MKQSEPGMGIIVKTITRLTVGLILIYGIYIVLQGHLGPGGGFAGGVIAALSFIHLVLAFGKEAVVTKARRYRELFLIGIGVLAFLFLTATSCVSAGRHYEPHGYFTFFNTWYMPLAELAIALLVGTGLFMIFLALTLQSGEMEEK